MFKNTFPYVNCYKNRLVRNTPEKKYIRNRQIGSVTIEIKVSSAVKNK